MTALQTLRDPKVERLTDGFASQSRVETAESEESLQEWYRSWCNRVDERQKEQGFFDEEPLSMEEVVAICKEARAECYANKQNDSAGR